MEDLAAADVAEATHAGGTPVKSPVIAANWAVKKPEAVPAPTSENYTSWSVEQLRKECTSRNLRLYRKMSSEERIKRLLAFDDLHRSLVTAALE